MNLPEEDSTALRKRSAIQSVMKDKSLSGAQRHVKIQEIMRGNFDNVDIEESSASDESEEESVGSEEVSSSSSEGSYETDDDSSSDDENNSKEERSNNNNNNDEEEESFATESASEHTQHDNDNANNNNDDEESAASTQSAASTRSNNSNIANTNNHRRGTESSYETTTSSSSGGGGHDHPHGKNETDDDDDDSDSSSYSRRSSISTSVGDDGDYNESDVIMSRSGNDVNKNKKKKGTNGTNKTTSALLMKQQQQQQQNDDSPTTTTTSTSSSSSSLQSIITQVQNNSPSLTTLNLPSQNLSDTDLIPLFQSLSSNTYITSLLLPNNQLSNEGCSALASTILDNTTLSTIDISNNRHIGIVGLDDLSKALPYNYTLKSLNMSHIGKNFGMEGASIVALALTQNESLTELILNGNFIGGNTDDNDIGKKTKSDVGAVNLFRIFNSENTTLQRLSLQHNGIGDKGANALANALLDNETLIHVDLSYNTITDRGAQDIVKVLDVNETLEMLILEGNDEIDKGILEEIQRVIEESGSESSSESGRESEEESSYESGSESGSEEGDGGGGGGGSESEEGEAGSITLDDEDNEGGGGGGGGGEAPLTGGEAMLEDMPDEDNAALAKRQLIQQIMKDKSLSAADRNKKIQDVMAGRVELPKVERKLVQSKPSPPPSSSTEEASAAPLTGGEAMLEDMPDEDNAALAKRQLIQQIMKDKSLSAADRNKKIQDVMAGRVELPKVEPKPVQSKPSPPTSSTEEAGAAPLTGGEAMLEDMPDEDNAALAKRQLIQQIMKDKSLSAADRNKKIQDVMVGRVELPKVEPKLIQSKPSPPPTSSTEEAGAAPLTGGEAMLEDMPDEDNAALAKRQLIQQIMKDKSLSAADRNKKIQDVMAGRVELPKVEPKPAETAPPSVVKADKPPVPEKRKKVKSGKPKAAPAGGGKDENSNERKKALQAIMMDTSLSAPERQQKIQEIMEGKKPSEANGSSKKTEHIPPTSVIEVQKPDDNIAQKVREHKSKLRRKKSSVDSAGGVVPTNIIAQEWKRKMMEPHPRSHDDLLDILLAHKYRLSLQSPPKQSCFRVVAVVFFSLVVNGVRRSERYHVVGTNDEPHSIAGSICAERAALMQLRFMPNLESITKIVIVTDDADAITPGMLCREFMASHDRIPWDVPIILGRSVCKKCGFSITGNACGDSMSCFSDTEEFQKTQSNIFAMCSTGHEESKHKQYITPHDFLGTETTLRELFPYPSLYTRLSGREALQMGERYLETNHSNNNNSSPKKKKELDSRNILADKNIDASDDESSTSAGSFRQERFDLTMLADILEDEEAENMDGDRKKRPPEEKRSSFVSPAQRKSSITHSLKTTIDFMRQIQEDAGNNNAKGGPRGGGDLDASGLGIAPDSLDRLTASKIRISSRLKPSQRREKLLKMATEATVYESHQRHAHPIRYGAAVLFSDNTVSIASQKVAIEYGCTLDAVGQLASIIDRKALQIDEEKPAIRPILLVQCDQFGIAHPPFAQGRAFLTERGYGDCKILLHQQRQSRPYPTIMEEKSLRDFDEEDKKEEGKVDLRLIEVDANSLAPSPPDIFGVVKATTKTHSSRLQIQF